MGTHKTTATFACHPALPYRESGLVGNGAMTGRCGVAAGQPTLALDKTPRDQEQHGSAQPSTREPTLTPQ